MQPVLFNEAETCEPEEEWRRVAMAGSDQFSFEWFEKPPGHTSPTHHHENEQICLVTEGELTLVFESEAVTLGPYDSVLIESGEPHRAENTGDDPARGVDAFAPGRSFDFWLDRE